MTLSALTFYALATSYVVDLWLYSRIFVRLRCRLQKLPDPWGYLFKCPMCLTTWVPLLLMGMLWLLPMSELVFCALAIARVSTIIKYLLDHVRDPDNDGWSCGQQEEYESARKHGTSEEYV